MARLWPQNHEARQKGVRMSEADTIERNKELVRRLEQAFTDRDIEALDGIFAPDYVEHDREDFTSFFGWVFRAFPDADLTVDNLVAADDRVGCRMAISGTHEGELFGVAPTGRRVSFVGIDIFRAADGKLAEHWGVADAAGLMRQVEQ